MLQDLGCRGSPKMENQMERKLDNEMDAGVI